MRSRKLTLRPQLVPVLFLVVSCLCRSGWTQAAPSAFRGADSFWVGINYANFDAAFPHGSGSRLSGIGADADFYWGAHLGIEGAARFFNYGGYHGEKESNYLAGPIYRVRDAGRLRPFARALLGVGRIHYPYALGDANYLAVAPAVGTTYRISPRLALSAAYEYQFWLDSPGYSNQPAHPLRPNGMQLGISYRVFH